MVNNGLNNELFFDNIIIDVLGTALVDYYENTEQKETKYNFIKDKFEKCVEINFRKDGVVFWGTNEEIDRFVTKYTQAIEKFALHKSTFENDRNNQLKVPDDFLLMLNQRCKKHIK